MEQAQCASQTRRRTPKTVSPSSHKTGCRTWRIGVPILLSLFWVDQAPRRANKRPRFGLKKPLPIGGSNIFKSLESTVYLPLLQVKHQKLPSSQIRRRIEWVLPAPSTVDLHRSLSGSFRSSCARPDRTHPRSFGGRAYSWRVPGSGSKGSPASSCGCPPQRISSHPRLPDQSGLFGPSDLRRKRKGGDLWSCYF